MNFRDDDQRSQVCLALLGFVGREALWTVAGPTARARELLASGGPMSAGEGILFRFAWTIWGEDCGVKLDELFRLGPKSRHALARLIVAMTQGPDAIDGWLTEARDEAGP